MVKREDIYYDSRNGKTKIHAVKWYEEGKNPKAVLQIIHGMAEYITRYDDFANFMVSKGFVVVGEDHLGHGDSVDADTPHGYFCEQDPATVVVRDNHRLKKLIQEQYPGIPYIIFGHSMGSFILRNYLFRYGTGIDGAIVCGTGYQSAGLLGFTKLITGIQNRAKGAKYPSEFINKMAFGSYLKKIKPVRTAFDWLSTDDKVVDSYIADEKCGFTFTVNGFQTLFELLRRAINMKNLKQMPSKLPVLFIAGKEDPVGDYGEGVLKVVKLFEEAQMECVHMKFYDGMRHEIMNETKKETVYNDILDWLDSLALYS